MNEQNNYKGYFHANTTYISNRLLFNRHSISDALNDLVEDGFIFRRDVNGEGTYIKLNQKRILQIAEDYKKSEEYKSLHKNLIEILEEEEQMH